METVLAWIALGVGVVGALFGAVMARRDESERETAGLWMVAAVVVLGTILLFLVTLPGEPPVFSLGQRLGYGILIGGLLGVLAGVLAPRMLSAGLASLALFGVGLVLLLFHGYPQPALGGFLIGSVLSTVIFRLALPQWESIYAWGIPAVTLGATVLLATFRYDTVSSRLWWTAPLIVLAAVIIATFAASGITRRSSWTWLPVTAAAVLTLILIAAFAWKLFPEWALLWLGIAGIGSFAIIAWQGSLPTVSASAAAGVALLVVALSAMGFRLLGGFGIGIALLAGWTVFLPAIVSVPREADEGPQAGELLTYAAFIGVGMVLLRLFLENYTSQLRGLDLYMHYTFVSIALGAVAPFVLVSFLSGQQSRSLGWRVAGAVVMGLFAAASPLLILVIWGFKAALAFLIGTVVAEIFLLFGSAGNPKRMYNEAALLIIAAQVAAVQFAGLLGPIADSPRLTRGIILAAAVVLGLAWSGVNAMLDRRSREG